MNEGDCTASDLMRHLCDELQKSMTDAYFCMPDEAGELYNILSSPHIRAIGSCIAEISSGNFFTPSLPSTGIYVIEGTLNSQPQGLYNDFLRGIYSLNRGDPITNGLGKCKSEILLINGKDDVAISSSSLNSVPGGVKLTGGGEGLPMKPVDEDELMIISFKRSSEDLVRLLL